MKLIFVHGLDFDWFEKENRNIPMGASYFLAVNMREWFLKWVFK